MRFGVVGADKESGRDVEVLLVASCQEEAEAEAAKRGILVSGVKPVAEETDVIEMVIEDEPPAKPSPAASATPAAAPGRAVGTISNHPQGARDHATAHTGPAAMEYHILMNQSLFLLETAVNKHIHEGWEPQGGLTVGMSNNASQFYQSMIRRRK